MPDLALEAALAAEAGRPIAGVDEVGRGPLAGPVTACAVILPDPVPEGLLARLDDSKKLSPARRADAAAALRGLSQFAIVDVPAEEIDRINILQATMLAMHRAVAALDRAPAGVLVDGNRDPGLGLPTRCIVKGDARSASIAAASILAKCHRDAVMAMLAEAYPGYGWERNAGYGSAAHRDALARLGPTPYHRRSFAPLRDDLQARLSL